MGTLKRFAQHNFARVNSSCTLHLALRCNVGVRGRGYFNDSDVVSIGLPISRDFLLRADDLIDDSHDECPLLALSGHP